MLRCLKATPAADRHMSRLTSEIAASLANDRVSYDVDPINVLLRWVALREILPRDCSFPISWVG